MVRGRHGRRRVRQPKAVPDDDEEGEPRRALADDPRGEHGDGDTRNREDPPKIALSEKLRSEEHTSELQSRSDLVCRLLLEKKKQILLVRDEYRDAALSAFAERGS